MAIELQCLEDAPADLVRGVQKLNLGALPVQPPDFIYRRSVRETALRLCWAAVAVDGDDASVAGAVLAELEPDLKKSGPATAVVQIRTLAVAPHFRRQGVGQKLLETVIERTRALAEQDADGRPRIRGLSLHVHEPNDDARRLYERLGFQEVTRLEGYYRRLKPATAIAMHLPLVE